MTSESATEGLLRHMEWAEALIWNTILSSPAAVDDPALKERLYHIHVTQHAFLRVWRGVTGETPAADTLDMASLARWARAFHAQTTADTSWLSEAALDRQAPDSLVHKAEERLGPGTTLPTICDTVFQVVMHSAYHRGQVGTRLRELGCEPPLTEYFVWVWRGKPAAIWPVGTSDASNHVN